MQYEFSTKLNNRKNSAGVVIEKVRVWLEESTNNRFLSDHGFKRGAPVDIVTKNNSIQITLIIDNEANAAAYEPEGKRAKVAGKDDRSLFDITRNANQMPESFHPEYASRLIASVKWGQIIIKAKVGS